jgi:hypothetical protein
VAKAKEITVPEYVGDSDDDNNDEEDAADVRRLSRSLAALSFETQEEESPTAPEPIADRLSSGLLQQQRPETRSRGKRRVKSTMPWIKNRKQELLLE